MLKIGEVELEVGAPDAGRLLASTGQSVATMRRLLEDKLMPGLVAAALHACAAAKEDMLSVHELAVRIEHDGVDKIRSIVRELFGEEPASEAAESPVSEPALQASVSDEGPDEPAADEPEADAASERGADVEEQE